MTCQSSTFQGKCASRYRLSYLLFTLFIGWLLSIHSNPESQDENDLSHLYGSLAVSSYRMPILRCVEVESRVNSYSADQPSMNLTLDRFTACSNSREASPSQLVEMYPYKKLHHILMFGFAQLRSNADIPPRYLLCNRRRETPRLGLRDP